jgi:hypothetical protein
MIFGGFGGTAISGCAPLRKARSRIKSRPDPRLKSELCLAWSFKEFDIVTPPDIGLKRPKMSPRFASGHSQKWLCH